MKQNRIDEIFSELQQIREQYKAEVPSGRRAWPVSVKMRVFELRSLGLRDPEISRKSKLCYQTLRTWQENKKTTIFLPVQVKRERSLNTVVGEPTPTVTVGVDARSSVTVITPTGFKIEGLDQATVIEIVRILR